MKSFIKIFLPLQLIVGVSGKISAQTNNPYDAKGIQLKNAIVTLYTDFKAGKIRDYSQQTIDRYSAAFSIGATIPQSFVASLYNDLTQPDFNYVTYINNSTLSRNAKSFAIQILNESRNPPEKFQGSLITKVEEIKKSTLSNSEKELLLTNCAAYYHLLNIDDKDLHARLGEGSGDGLGIGYAVGAVAGGIAGFTLCGPLCAFGGAIIGGFIGAVGGSLFDK